MMITTDLFTPENIAYGIITELIAAVFFIGAAKLIAFFRNTGLGFVTYLYIFIALLLLFTPTLILVFLYYHDMVVSLYLLLFNLIMIISSFALGYIAYNKYKKESDLYKFIKSAKKQITDRELFNCICSIRKAFHEIENICNKNFKRGQVINDKMQIDSIFEGQLPYRITSNLELDLYYIYEKHIKRTVFKNNILTDIHRGAMEPDLNNNYRWILDTLDGGLHFLRNIPLFTTCVALQRNENNVWKTIFSAIYIPLTKEIFFAVKGQGAYLNSWDGKLPLKRRDSLEDSIFYIEFPGKSTRNYEKACEFLNKVFPKVKKIRGFNLGSFGLAYMAKGSFDAYISLSESTSFFDSEAGKLLVEESIMNGNKDTQGIFIKEEIQTSKHGFDLCSRIFASSEQIYAELKKDGDLYPLLKELFSMF